MLRQFLSLLVLIGLLFSSSHVAAAPQEIAQMQEALKSIESSPMSDEQKQKAREQIEKQMAAKRGGGKKPDEKKPDDKKKGDDKKKEGDDKKKEEPTTVKRPEKPKKPADPKELEATPTNGKLILKFRGHPWPAMVDWYSRVTGRMIEWQELPKGPVYLGTQNPMTMDETGDLLNRLLLGRGFTMLDDGRFLQIVKTEGINPSFVPRVEPQQLATLSPHGFVRTSFMLHRFKAEDIVKELEAMKSKHGKLSAMTAANRIEAMDIVSNLRDIHMALDREQSSGVHAPKEFEIKYLRADLVKEKLSEMLGLESKKQQAPMNQQQMQQMMQRRQQQQQQNKGKPPGAAKEAPKINMIVNELKNSIIVKAPPHKMLDIADAIQLLDVRPTRDSLNIRSYTLATRTPEEVAELLNESGALSPSAIIRVDKKTKTLLVSGTKFDHFRIDDLITRIDGNARRFVSIRLRRYPAVQVATTIEKMMGVGEEDDSNSRNRRYYWWDNNDKDDEDKADKFRVTADVENNRLILKCNDAEYKMVMELLTQMGEVLTRSKFTDNQVVLEDIVDEDEMLRRVQEAFKAYAPNAVVLPPPREEKKAEEEEKESTIKPGDAIDARTTLRSTDSPFRTMFTQVVATRDEQRPRVTETAAAAPAPTPPPIFIERNAQGKLVLRSKDAAALEMFEELVRQMAPKTQDWVHIKMKHVTAYWMKLQLEDFFEEDEEKSPFFFYWDFDDDKDKPPGLGDERKMKFIDDGESTLVIRNASPKQLATVRQLVALYDVSEPPNEQNARFKKMIHIKFSKARTIETVLKDTFRDLLSSNDKAFEQKNKGDGENDRGSRRFYNPFFNDDDEGDLAGSTFKGNLSFGVDESTNILIITAKGKNLLDIVVDMVEELDRAAVPTDETRVVPVPPNLNSVMLRETLTRMFGEKAVGKPDGDKEEGEEGGEGGDDQKREFEAAMNGRRGR